jgi:preprotein translocase subunit SecF
MRVREAISTFRGHRVPNIAFIRRKNRWFGLSGLFIVLSLVGLFARGLNFSIAFKGGSLLQFENKSGASVQDYESIMARFGRQDAQVAILGTGTVQIKTRSLTELGAVPSPTPTATATTSPGATPSGTPTPSATPSATATPSPSPTATPTVTPTTEGPVPPTSTPSVTPSATASPTAAPTASPTATPTATPSGTPSPTASGTVTPTPSVALSPGIPTFKADQLRAALAAEAGIAVEDINEQDVGPTWGNTISHKMYVGLVIFLLLVTLYITLRFEWKMAVAGLVALAHDIIITAGIYALVGREVTPETVIAILTILGYSLYDTVVIFDKVKENTESAALVARDTYSGVVNMSLNQTLMRSVNTSLVVLLPIGSLLLFGGQTLKDFAFALFIGVASGTYSSIFVAAPLLSILKEREPRYVQIKARAQARASRPGLRSVPPSKAVSSPSSDTEVTDKGTTPTATRRPPSGAGAPPRPGGKKKKGKPQGKPKRRRR